jgi:CBS-domain-containing membrane protein
MHASDIVETLPTATLDDDLLSVIRTLVEHCLPGLPVTDASGEVVGCMSSVDLLRAALPRYLHNDCRLARVLDESAADRIARTLTGLRVRDVVGTLTPVPGVRPQATAVELAQLMAERGCSIVVVDKGASGEPGVVTVNHLLELLVATAEDGDG